MLANIINPYIKRIIHDGKVGFLPGVKGRFNIQK